MRKVQKKGYCYVAFLKSPLICYCSTLMPKYWKYRYLGIFRYFQHFKYRRRYRYFKYRDIAIGIPTHHYYRLHDLRKMDNKAKQSKAKPLCP